MTNIKYIYTILFLSLALNFPPVASAQTAKPTVKPSVSPTTSENVNQKLNTQINQLKDKIASRVSELNLVEKRGVIGTVTEVSSNKITLEDVDGETKQVDVDEITKFSSPTSKTFGLSDIKKDSKISVLGLYNKQSKRLLARFIRTSVDPEFLTGAVSSIDTRNLTFEMVSPDQKKTKIDVVQTTTKISTYGEDGELTRLLFARLEVGNRVIAVGFPDKTDPAMIVASRITVFPKLPNDPKIEVSVQPTDAPTPSPTVSTRRVTPTSAIRRVTPTSATR